METDNRLKSFIENTRSNNSKYDLVSPEKFFGNALDNLKNALNEIFGTEELRAMCEIKVNDNDTGYEIIFTNTQLTIIQVILQSLRKVIAIDFGSIPVMETFGYYRITIETVPAEYRTFHGPIIISFLKTRNSKLVINNPDYSNPKVYKALEQLLYNYPFLVIYEALFADFGCKLNYMILRTPENKEDINLLMNRSTEITRKFAHYSARVKEALEFLRSSVA